MISSIQNVCHNYYEQLPPNTLRSIGLSALFTFTASTIVITLGADITNQPVSLARPALAAAVTMTATAIHALTTPIFNYLFENPTNKFSGGIEFLKTFTTLTLTHLLFSITSYKVNLLNPSLIKGDGFITFPGNIFKQMLGMLQSLDNLLKGNQAQPTNGLGMDFNQNPNPVYLTA